MAEHHEFELEKGSEYPDGGRGWGVLVGTFLGMFTTYGMVQSFGIYEAYYEQAFPDLPLSRISLIGSLMPLIIYAFGIPTVAMMNTVGVKWSVGAGYFVMILGIMLTSISSQLWHLYLCQGVVFSIGAGVVFFITMTIPSEWFLKRRALAAGITSAGSSVGGVVWPIITQRMFDTVGFAWGNRIIGFVYMPLMAVSLVAIKPRVVCVQQHHRQVLPDWRVLKSKRLLLYDLGMASALLGYFAPMFYMPSFVERLGHTAVAPQLGDNVLTIINAGTFFGRMVIPLVADKLGRLNMLVLTVFLTGAVQAALWYPARGTAMVAAFVVLFGIFNSTHTALGPAAMAQLFGMERNQSRLSIMFLLAGAASFAGPMAASSFLPAGGSPTVDGYRTMILFSSCSIMGASLLLVVFRFCYTRKMFVFI